MNQDDMNQGDLGKVVRKVRTEKGKNLEDLAKEIGFSHTTLSRFERGELALKDTKLELLLELLEINPKDIPAILAIIQLDEDIELFTFYSIESQVKVNSINQSQFNKKLANIKHEISKQYLKGKRFFLAKDYKKARKQYQLVIGANEEDHWPNANLIPTAYVDLAFISISDNDHKSALLYLDRALETFNLEGERRHTWHSIHYNRAHIHFELGNIDQSEKCLEPIWSEVSQIEGLLKLKVYELKADIMRERKLNDEARAILRDALLIACVTEDPDGICYILVASGKLAFEMELYTEAERCFQSAIDLDIKDKLRKTTATAAYYEMSCLYLFQNDLKKAKKHIKKAIQESKKAKDMHDLIRAYIIEGGIYEKQGNKFDACNNYKDALELADQYEYDQYKPTLNEHIYRCDHKGGIQMGDPHDG
jgi:tetratricopeptide (TPR) repeat protein